MYSYETIHKIKLSKYTARVMLVMGIVLMISMAMNVYAITKVNGVQDQIQTINQEVSESKEANQEVLAMLQEVRDNQKRQNEALQISLKKELKRNNRSRISFYLKQME